MEHRTQVLDKALRQAKLHEFCPKNQADVEVGLCAGRRYGPGEYDVGRDDPLTYLFGLPDGIGHRWCTGKRGSGRALRRKRELEPVVCAIRRIRASEELFLDCVLVIDGDDAADYPCACRTRACSGTMEASAAASV
jgi:hypothetical protein